MSPQAPASRVLAERVLPYFMRNDLNREPLTRNADGTFTLPAKKGRLLLEVPGYFR